jgi:hypothetical protein
LIKDQAVWDSHTATPPGNTPFYTRAGHGKEKQGTQHSTPKPGGQAHNRIINKDYRKHPTQYRMQWQTPLKENCAKHNEEE